MIQLASWPLGGSKAEYGSKPIVPGRIDYEQSLQGIIQSNINLLPSLTELGLMSTDSLNALLERTLPGFTNLRDTTTGILQDKLKGNLSRDVELRLGRDLAEEGIALGTSGSDANKYRGVLGRLLESQNIQNEGLAQTSSWLAQNRGNTFDFTKMFLGKDEAVRETEFNWERDWLKSQVDAAPDPVARGKLDTELAMVGMLAGVYAGAAPQQRYQQTYSGRFGGGGGGEQAAMGGSSYFGDSGGTTIGYTPTNWQGGIQGSGAAGGSWDIGAGSGAAGASAADWA